MSEATISSAISATPRCPHFGTCGGCQYQHLAYTEQLRRKRERLESLLQQAAIALPGPIAIHSGEPYTYRNRIRLRLERSDGILRFGYNQIDTTDFLPIVTCPISAPTLVSTAEALITTAQLDRDAAFWVDAASEVELFCDHDTARVQVTLHCAPRTKSPPGSFARMLQALQLQAPQVVGASAIASDLRTGPTGRTLDATGAPGLAYRVADETYWITRGGFFQVNRFLLETLVHLVCSFNNTPRTGTLAWDLFAGVGLFSRVLTRSFTRVTAVEANPSAAQDLRTVFAKTSPQSISVEATTLNFLQRAVLDRDRPTLVVLDPPRAGAGTGACELLNRIAPQTIVYVSCDPLTLARDLQSLASAYTIEHIDLVDLFPQTMHIETVVVLQRRT